MLKHLCRIATVPLCLLLAGAAKSGAVDFDVKSLLNFRFCATTKDGKVISLTDNVDGAGGLATESATKLLGDEDPHALPDDGHFSATADHPAVVLNYSNDDATGMQARRCPGKTEFSFEVPAAKYAEVYLWMMSGQGPSDIVVTMTYADGSTDTRSMQVPDWFWDVKAGDKDHCFLVSDLGKWDIHNKMIEKRHHAIFGLLLHPTGKPLKTIKVEKSVKGLMVFFGATGVSQASR